MFLTSMGHSHRLDWHVWSDCLSTGCTAEPFAEPGRLYFGLTLTPQGEQSVYMRTCLLVNIYEDQASCQRCRQVQLEHFWQVQVGDLSVQVW